MWDQPFPTDPDARDLTTPQPFADRGVVFSKAFRSFSEVVGRFHVRTIVTYIIRYKSFFAYIGHRLSDMETPRFFRLRAAMRRARITQQQLAKTLGLSQPAVSDILKGKSSGDRHIPTIAKALKVSEVWITSGEDAPSWVPKGTIESSIALQFSPAHATRQKRIAPFSAMLVEIVCAGLRKKKDDRELSEDDFAKYAQWFFAMNEDYCHRYINGQVGDRISGIKK